MIGIRFAEAFRRRLKQNRLDEFVGNAFRGKGRVYCESEGLGRSLCKIRSGTHLLRTKCMYSRMPSVSPGEGEAEWLEAE